MNIQKQIKKLLPTKNNTQLILQNSFINLNKEFKFTAYNEFLTKDLETQINTQIDRESKQFKKFFKKISKEKNLQYQNIFRLNEVDFIIDKIDEGISLFCDLKNKDITSFLNSKLLKRLFKIKKPALISIEDFTTVYPEIEKLKQLGINVVYKKGEAKAKVSIFPTDESFFTKHDIFKRQIIIDDETMDLSALKDKINGNFIFYKDKLIEIDENFLKDIQKSEELSYIEVVREHIENTTSINEKLKDFLSNKIEFIEIEVPEMKDVTLEEYQKEGVQWLVNNYLNGFGSILADDMGLGKTLQTITTVQYLKDTTEELKVLIILPTAVLLNWESEIQRFSTLSSSFYYGPSKKIHETDIILTTYGTVTYDELLKETQWDLIVIDEAQKIKNFDSLIANKINLIPSNSRIALTGTPVENSLMDLWSIFNFVIPGYLGAKEDFASKYKVKDISEQLLAILKKSIDPFLLRRDKSILDLPDKHTNDILIELSIDQQVIYNKVVEESLKEIELINNDETLSAGQKAGKKLGIILSTITKLKQVCNHPGNYSPDLISLESGKLEELKNLVKYVKNKNEKIIIFTQYVTMVNILENEFEGSLIFHGGMNVKQRLETLQAFKDDDMSVLIISLKAGGTGLNIVEANHVVHYDLWFNPAVENQATDRAHRRGQVKDVLVSRFISKGTFEEKINDLIVSKKDLFDRTLNGGELAYLSKMEDEELRKLFVLS